MTGLQIARLPAHPTPSAVLGLRPAQNGDDTSDGLGFHAALLRRASGHAIAFCWLTPETRNRLPREVDRDRAPERMSDRLAALCRIAPLGLTPLIIADLRADDRTQDLPLVTGAPHLTSFAGFPLIATDGEILGMACVADARPRPITSERMETLQRLTDELAVQVERKMTGPRPAPRSMPATAQSAIAVEPAETATSCDADPQRHALSAMLMQWRDTLPANLPQSRGYLQRMVVRLTESRHNLGKIEAIRHNERETAGSRALHDKGLTRPEGERAVASRLSGAILRAILVMALVVMPSAILPGVTTDAQQMAAFVAFFAGAMTFVEYNAVYPGLIEFRHAPPFNRTRFALLVGTVLLLCLIERGRVSPTALTQFLDAVGSLVGWAMDFPYSPVRLAMLMLDNAATAAQVAAVRTAAGMALLVTMVTLIWFVLTMRAGGWPSRRAAFNVWVNLPTFDPTVGADIIRKLDRDARVNVALGFLLPFLIPAVVRIGSSGLEPLALMIREKRQAAAIGGAEGLLPA
ncbi:MAG: hypothetical protein CFE34_07470 [Rhodobacteraceae bacterium PARR1]|nr:MAG: hypothetical protein CFE34_07470 [Rhodobacteraceae bacterium PARR1]